MTQELTALEYIAQLINTQKSLAQGYTMPTRWLCLREDLKEQYLNEAKELVKSFSDEEIVVKTIGNQVMIKLNGYNHEDR